MADSVVPREQLEGQLIRKALKDDAFRQQLMDDPKAAIEKETGLTLPANVQVKTLQETDDLVYLVLPAAPSAQAPLGEGELSSAADCSGWKSFGECTVECTQCGNNETSCQPGDTEG